MITLRLQKEEWEALGDAAAYVMNDRIGKGEGIEPEDSPLYRASVALVTGIVEAGDLMRLAKI